MTGVQSEVPGKDDLRDVRIGFYTSVVGMGGSEVLVVDAMEAAFSAGAEIICWSHPKAAIKVITASRSDRLQVIHLDWPVGRSEGGLLSRNEAQPSIGIRNGSPAGNFCRRLLSIVWRRCVPLVLKRRKGFRRTTQGFLAELRRVRPDLLFVNVNGSEAVSLAGHAAGIPTVNCYHLSYTKPNGGYLSRLQSQAERRSTMHAGVLTVHTSAAARDEWSRTFGLPLERTRLIYNGVDPVDPPQRDVVRTSLGIRNGEFVFCVPGRLDPIKGHVHLIEAVSQLRGQFDNACVLVCGEGSLKNDLERMCQTAGISAIVRFLGFRSDLPAVLASVDCVVLPSVESENLSVAVLEGLMAGTPAIVTKVGGMAEAVRDGETGFVVPPGKPKALAHAMTRILSNRAMTAQMGVKASQDASIRFSRKRMMGQYVDLFREVYASVDQKITL